MSRFIGGGRVPRSGRASGPIRFCAGSRAIFGVLGRLRPWRDTFRLGRVLTNLLISYQRCSPRPALPQRRAPHSQNCSCPRRDLPVRLPRPSDLVAPTAAARVALEQVRLLPSEEHLTGVPRRLHPRRK